MCLKPKYYNDYYKGGITPIYVHQRSFPTIKKTFIQNVKQYLIEKTL